MLTPFSVPSPFVPFLFFANFSICAGVLNTLTGEMVLMRKKAVHRVDDYCDENEMSGYLNREVGSVKCISGKRLRLSASRS